MSIFMFELKVMADAFVNNAVSNGIFIERSR